MNAIKTILVADDEIEIVDLLRRYLEREDYCVLIAQTGLEAIGQIEERHPDLVLLDVMLPELTGLDVCKRLRAHPHTRQIPIIMVSAKADETDVILGLELGADDYVTKPFSPRAVMSRVRTILRRLEPALQQEVLVYDNLILDLSRFEASINGHEVLLTYKEFRLLEYILRNRERILTQQNILESVWDDRTPLDTRTVAFHMHKLKGKIPFLDSAIVCVKGLGYKLQKSPSAPCR